jgi:prophage regulatory protein
LFSFCDYLVTTVIKGGHMEALAPRPLRILRLRDVKAKTGQATSTIYAAMASGNFPKPIPLGERAVGWLESEIDAWIEACLRKRETRAA